MSSQGWQPERCECGHTAGEHQSAGASFPHPPRYGTCHVHGCDCRKFTRDAPEQEAAA